MNEMTLYWITRLDGIKVFLGFMSMIVLIWGLVYSVHPWDDSDEKVRTGGIAAGVLGALVLILVNVLIPSTKHMAIIKVVPPVVEGAQKANVPERVVNALLGLIEQEKKGKANGTDKGADKKD